MSINKFWRAFATSLAFVSAALILPAVGLLVIPTLRLVFPSKHNRVRSVRWVYSRLSQLLFWWAQFSGCMKLEFENLSSKPSEATLFVANHPSFIDFLAFLTICPDVACVVKGDLTKSRILSYLIESAGYMTNASESALIDSCVESLFNGESLIVFPEGTRSVGIRPRKFQRGAASVALGARCRIVPIFYTCVPVTLQKRHSWFEVPDQAFKLSLKAGKAFKPNDVIAKGLSRSLARRHLTSYLENLFEEQLVHGRAAA